MKILVLGANSAIAQASVTAIANKQAKKNAQARFYLVGRNPQKLEQIVNQMNGQVDIAGYEALDLRDHMQIQHAVHRSIEAMGAIDTVLIAHGALAKQADCMKSSELLEAMIDENFVSHAIAINTALPKITQCGTIAIITSVAGEAARPNSATYSATKAALSRYIQGMRGVAATRKVRLIDIRPGWVETPMTANSTSKFLTVMPQKAGNDIANAILGRRPSILYTPWFWRFIMMPIKALPMQLFRFLRP